MRTLIVDFARVSASEGASLPTRLEKRPVMVSDSSDMTAQCLGAVLLSLYAFDFRVFYRHTLQAAAAASVPMDIHVYTRVCTCMMCQLNLKFLNRF